jgi:uncharacterized membrane protein YfcA
MDSTKALIIAGAGMIGGAMNAMAGGGTMVTFPALMWSGLSPMLANMTSTVALFPGMPVGIWSFRKHLKELTTWLKVLAPISLLGGLAGAILLLKAGSDAFNKIVPWLLLMATILLMVNGVVQRWMKKKLAGKPGADIHKTPPLKLWSILFLAGVAVYGGYFGAGIGIMALAAMGLLGLTDINEMNALKVVLTMLMNFAAVVWFIIGKGVVWDHAIVLMIGSMLGYWGGSHIAQRIPPAYVRGVGVVIGLVISIQLFWKQAHGS